MRMIEKEIIEGNNRFVTKSELFVTEIFLKKFPFQFRCFDANDRREGNDRTAKSDRSKQR